MAKSDRQKLMVALMIPTMLLSCPLVGYFLGRTLESFFPNIFPFKIVGLLLGLLAAFVDTKRSIKKLED